MLNDSKSYTEDFMVFIKLAPGKGLWRLKSNGEFSFTNVDEFYGTLVFTYKICKIGNGDLSDEAQIVVNIKKDTDCDGLLDEIDIDDDNDGILDFDDGLTADTDGDGLPNCLDIDSDNDGIPDNVEAQKENQYQPPLCRDTDGDGWDDAYDPDNTGSYFSLTDTDKDGMPDFVDTNSDNDRYSDFNEAFDADFDTIPDVVCAAMDCDFDGLDDNFDIIHGRINRLNPTGHNAPLPDFNKNGIRDWRDSTGNKPIPGFGLGQHANENLIIVYPNPAKNSVGIKISPEIEGDQFELGLYNTSGELLLQEIFYRENRSVNISELIPGIYILQVKNGLLIFTEKLHINE